MRDYVAWHDHYDDPGSSLSLRLLVVQDQIARVLDESPPGRVRFVSACAGQGRDVLTVAHRHRRGTDLQGRLVEAEPENVATARATVARHGLDGIEVVEGDAGTSDAYAGAVPADLVLLCGVFGNIPDEEVAAIIHLLPMLCAPGAWVVWTRGPREDPIVETIQSWFADAGFPPVELIVAADRGFGVGTARFVGTPAPFRPGTRFFEFVV
jgi:hypothetical protein